jgi:hypothetical protein
MRCRLIRKEKETMMRLKNGILTLGGVEFELRAMPVNGGTDKHIIDVLEEVLFVARAAHRNLWSKDEVYEALMGAYEEMLKQENRFRILLLDLSRRAGELAPYWSLHLEGLTHDLKGDDIPWYVGDDEEEATERPGTDEVREKISDLLITPRQAVPFASISHHILSNQEEGCWVEQNPRLLGVYADSFDRCLIIGLPAQKYSEFAWFNNGYGGLDEDELEVLVEFLALMMATSRHWGPLTVGKIEEEVSQMAMIAWKDLAERWHEGPVGALVEDYLRGGPVYKAASQAARIPHRI